MTDARVLHVDIRPWADGDLALLERLLGDPAMMTYLGGPESPAKIRERHARYCRPSDTARAFAVVVGPERQAVGWVGYWEKEGRGQRVWETGWSVLPESQGQGIGARATAIVIERARAEGRYQFLHAFPSVENGPSNAICRKLGFTLREEADFEYPPGHLMRCNDWCLDLGAPAAKARG